MFQKISDHSKHLLDNPQCMYVVYYSELNQWFSPNAFRSFSIKYVIKGCVNYSSGRFDFDVRSGHYLTACRYDGVAGRIDDTSTVRTLCIDICPATIVQAYTILTSGKEDFDNYLAGYFRYPEFLETVHQVNSSSLGNKLATLAYMLDGNAAVALNKEWFLDLTERMVCQEYGNFLALKEINTVKASTRKELLRRLQSARDFIDQNFASIQSISEVAEHCSMSEFHFYRRFKEVFKRTPYQYLTEVKLNHARNYLKEGKLKVTEVADICGYQDVFTFSKAFKKFFGMPPSELRSS